MKNDKKLSRFAHFSILEEFLERRDKMNVTFNKLCVIYLFILITVKEILSASEGNTNESSTTTTEKPKLKDEKSENTVLKFTKFDTDALLFHNVIRGLHNTMPLSLSTELKSNAMKSAAKLIQRIVSKEENNTQIEISQQDDDDDDESLEDDGTNWYVAELNGTNIATEEISTVPAIFDWYEQNKYYNFEQNLTGVDTKEKTMSNQTKSKEDPKNTEIVPTAKWRKYMHFIQIVWVKTRNFGCGYASNLKTLVILCRYRPSALPSKESSTHLNVRPLTVKSELLEPLLKFQNEQNDLKVDIDDGSTFSEEYYTGSTEKTENLQKKGEIESKKEDKGQEEKST